MTDLPSQINRQPGAPEDCWSSTLNLPGMTKPPVGNKPFCVARQVMEARKAPHFVKMQSILDGLAGWWSNIYANMLTKD